MNGTRDKITEYHRWTAYMKLRGQTCAREQEEILDEFEGFVQSLRGVGVDYDIIVMVEGRAPGELNSSYRARENYPKVSQEGGGA